MSEHMLLWFPSFASHECVCMHIHIHIAHMGMPCRQMSHPALSLLVRVRRLYISLTHGRTLYFLHTNNQSQEARKCETP